MGYQPAERYHDSACSTIGNIVTYDTATTFTIKNTVAAFTGTVIGAETDKAAANDFKLYNGKANSVEVYYVRGDGYGYFKSGLLVATTGATVTAGGLTVSADGATIAAGGLTTTTDGATITNAASANVLEAQATDGSFGATVLTMKATRAANSGFYFMKASASGTGTAIFDMDGTGISTFRGTTAATDAATGTIVTLGGVGVAKQLYTGGIITVLATTEASNTGTASIVTAGGIAVAKAIRAEGLIYTNGGFDSTASASSAPSGYFKSTASDFTDTVVKIEADKPIDSDYFLMKMFTADGSNNDVLVNSVDGQGKLTVHTGGLVVSAGGETVSGGLTVKTNGQTIEAGGLVVTAGGATVTDGASIAGVAQETAVGAGSLGGKLSFNTAANNAGSVTERLTVDNVGQVKITATTAASTSSATAGALVVAGGVGLAGGANIGGDAVTLSSASATTIARAALGTNDGATNGKLTIAAAASSSTTNTHAGGPLELVAGAATGASGSVVGGIASLTGGAASASTGGTGGKVVLNGGAGGSAAGTVEIAPDTGVVDVSKAGAATTVKGTLQVDQAMALASTLDMTSTTATHAGGPLELVAGAATGATGAVVGGIASLTGGAGTASNDGDGGAVTITGGGGSTSGGEGGTVSVNGGGGNTVGKVKVGDTSGVVELSKSGAVTTVKGDLTVSGALSATTVSSMGGATHASGSYLRMAGGNT
eukprot:g229.t1